ncbi:MAG: flagellar motor switch protein FliN [Planctomycetaceae bacterium]|nr:flagellar motor switch protein FliN [Planctomycetaceae bacterium]
MSDDLLTPEEIEALMQAARGPGMLKAPASPSATASAPPAASKPAAPASPPLKSSTESLLDEAENHLRQAVRPQAASNRLAGENVGASPFELPEFKGKSAAKSNEPKPYDAIRDVELDLRVELGRTELLIEEVLRLREGAVVPLDKLAGDPVDILVNGRLVARGEVLVLNDNFCVRIAEIVAPDL